MDLEPTGGSRISGVGLIQGSFMSPPLDVPAESLTALEPASMNDIFRTLPVSLVLAVSSATVSAEMITVCADGCDYTSINAAIGAANDGDVIQLAAETYFEGEQIDPLGKAITVRGVLGKAGEPASVLDGAGKHRVLICRNGETEATVFERLVIQNGSASFGAGMLNRNDSSPTLTNCTFTSNSAESYGGGMFNSTSSPNLINCAFASNSARLGGGMVNEDGSSPTLADCTFTGNSAYGGAGGGMFNESSSSPTLANCAFTGNSANVGAGMYNNRSTPNLTNCTFAGNAADYGGGGMGNYVSSPTLADCTFTSNSGFLGGGVFNELTSSPTLINCTFAGNSADYGGGMYNWVNSPILTACTLCENVPDQIDGSWTDAGGNCVATSCDDCDPPSDSCPTDLDRNGITDGGDLGVFFVHWGDCQVEDCPADFNDDEVVDGIDLGFLFSAWGPCR
ncbi:MAG: right-handed parallel beta-helix repeat-containing protein [Phycisphaerales bacterium]|nr:right-handed parallel beta-helix repeat-containing protein [Phycisphaerales bacterium]